MEIIFAEGFEHYNSIDDLTPNGYTNVPADAQIKTYEDGHKSLTGFTATPGGNPLQKNISSWPTSFPAEIDTIHIMARVKDVETSSLVDLMVLKRGIFIVCKMRLLKEITLGDIIIITIRSPSGEKPYILNLPQFYEHIELVLGMTSSGYIQHDGKVYVDGVEIGSIHSEELPYQNTPNFISLVGSGLAGNPFSGNQEIDNLLIIATEGDAPLGPLRISRAELTGDVSNSGWRDIQDATTTDLYQSVQSANRNENVRGIADFPTQPQEAEIEFSTEIKETIPADAEPLLLGVFARATGSAGAGEDGFVTANGQKVIQPASDFVANKEVWLSPGTIWTPENLPGLVLGAKREAFVPVGELIFEFIEATGTDSIILPSNVNEICIVGVMSGGMGYTNRDAVRGYSSGGGGGGRLSYSNNLPIVDKTIQINWNLGNRSGTDSISLEIDSVIYELYSGDNFQITNPGGSVQAGGGNNSGGAGAGGYRGQGGLGGLRSISTGGIVALPQPGTGGAGAGVQAVNNNSHVVLEVAGGVGLYGEGPSGTPASKNGSVPPSGSPNLKVYGGGSSVTYKNDVGVITIPQTGYNGAIRIMWGVGRSFPDNAGWLPEEA